MNRRLVASFLVLVVAGVLALWLFVGREVPQRVLVDERAASVETTATAKSSDLDAEAQTQIDARAALPSALPNAPGSSVPAAAASNARVKLASTVRDEERKLRGTLLVVDPGGGVHPSESGTFLLDQRQGVTLPDGAIERAPPALVVQVEQGRWSANVRRGLPTLRVLRFELDGRAAQLDSKRDRVDVPDDGELVLTVRWLPTSLLHVRAADTGAELRLVELNRADITLVPLGGEKDRRIIAEAANSPIEIVPTADMLLGKTITLSARAPGYAWGTIDLDLVQGGERVLTLVPGGTLKVRTIGEVATQSRRWVRLREKSKDTVIPILERPFGEGNEITLESLPARVYQVEIETGPGLVMFDPLASGEAEVLAGRTTTITLELHEPEEQTLVSVGGLLVIAPEWELGDEFSLHLYPIAMNDKALARSFVFQFELPGKDMHKSAGRADTFEWIAPKAWPGKYELSIDALSFATTIEVAPAGTTNLLIEVPAPARVRVRTVDKDSNAPAPITKLLYRMQHDDPAGATGVSTPARSSLAEPAGFFDFRVAPGKVALSPQTDGFASTWTTFDVQAGNNEFELPVVRSLGFVMTLADRDAIVPWGNRRPKARQIDGQGKSIGWGASEHGQKITVNAPGTYRVQIPSIDGFLPVPDQEVIVEAGKFTEHTIVLERAP